MRGKTAGTALIFAPPEDQSGPAMRACTPNQQAFVVAMVTGGANNPTQAAMLAGYGGTDTARKVAARDLMRNPRVLAALREEGDKFLRSGAIVGARAVMEIAMDPHHKDRFKAGVELLNRADLIVATKHEVVVTDNRTAPEVLQAIVAMAQKNGIDPKTLLGYDPDDILDVEFTEVEPRSAEGLEDLL
jgi:hypothetical protein